MHQKTPRPGWDEGSTAVEAAVIFSLLFTLVFGIVEFGMALWQLNTMQLVVLQEGRYAMVNNGTITQAIAQNDMQNMLPGATVSCPLPNNPGTGTWHVCAVIHNGTTPPTMALAANYGYSVLGLVGPFAVTAQTIVPLD